jgi:2-polyprenyl-6-methoxyphenol hydroxylase-like FAD-dependent oxidoreductase
LIGADGIHSAVRRHFHPGEGLPKWNGVTLWRSTTRMKAVDIEPTMIWAGYPDQKFVAYPIHLDRVRDEAVLNWICELRSADPGAAPPEDWNRMADRAEFAPRFAHWRWQGLDVPAIIEASEAIGVFPMTDRDPLPRWSFGRATLIGDAAHPMYPIGSNGATQAIIDARVLAYHLAGHGEVEAALADYETERRPATAQIVLANRAQGPDRVLDLAEQRAADPAIDLDNALPIEEREAIAAQYKSVAGFAPAELNARASYSPVGPRVR